MTAWSRMPRLTREQDKARREAADTRNAAESVAYSVDKLLKENGEKLPEDVKTEVRVMSMLSRRLLKAMTTMP